MHVGETECIRLLVSLFVCTSEPVKRNGKKAQCECGIFLKTGMVPGFTDTLCFEILKLRYFLWNISRFIFGTSAMKEKPFQLSMGAFASTCGFWPTSSFLTSFNTDKCSDCVSFCSVVLLVFPIAFKLTFCLYFYTFADISSHRFANRFLQSFAQNFVYTIHS